MKQLLEEQDTIIQQVFTQMKASDDLGEIQELATQVQELISKYSTQLLDVLGKIDTNVHAISH